MSEMLEVSDDLIFPYLVIILAFLIWFCPRQFGRCNYNDSRFHFYLDRGLRTSASLVVGSFTIYLIRGWASLISNLGLLKTNSQFQFFRRAIEHHTQHKFFSRLGDASKDLVINFAITAGCSCIFLVVSLLWRTHELKWSGREADGWFAFFVLLTIMAFLPFHFQSKFGSIRSLIPREWSEQEGRYLKPAFSSPAMLVDQWCKVKGFLTFQSGVILLNFCIIIALFGLAGLVMSWTPQRTTQSTDEEEGHELQNVAPPAQPVPLARPAGQEQSVTPSIGDQHEAQNTSFPQRSPFDDANAIVRPQRPAQALQQPNRNPFDDSNEIGAPRRDAPPTYHSTVHDSISNL